MIFSLLLILQMYPYLKYGMKLKNSNQIKVCLCALGKEENKYALEFVEHYKKYDVDKIFIYDNNDINGEKFEDVLSNYIKNDFIEIKNYRGKIHPQINVLRDCYKNNYKRYDWFIMYDMDEFIHLKGFNSIKNFLNDKKFSDCEIIYLNRAFHTDNNQIFYKNISLAERFPNAVNNFNTVKPILRGHIRKLIIICNHLINLQNKYCNGFGLRYRNKTDFKYYYIDHYYYKSTEEFIKKVNRGDSFFNNTNEIKFSKIKSYFKINKITLEKIEYVEKNTGFNLDEFRNQTLNDNKN